MSDDRYDPAKPWKLEAYDAAVTAPPVTAQWFATSAEAEAAAAPLLDQFKAPRIFLQRWGPTATATSPRSRLTDSGWILQSCFKGATDAR